MSTDRPSEALVDDWPRYTVTCTHGSEADGIDGSFADDEVVLFDPTHTGAGRWLAATEAVVVPVDEVP
jgi:hypothetical protein